MLWWRVAGQVETWRLQQVLHASAAAWALGVAVSIVVGGLVREYRVGWESTLLDLPQVHAFLRALFAPVVALLPLDGFTVADLERMHFRSGVQVARAEARHWVALYVGLLFIVVMLPRAALAFYARWRARRAAHRIVVDLRDPYFVTVLSRVGVRCLAQFLLQAARDAEEVKTAPFSVRRLISSSERDANLQAREEAMAALLQRVEQGLGATMGEIAQLHGREPPAAASTAVSRDFIVHDPVDAPQAGVAGAAAGVAAGALAGAKVDLLSGGLTMGAATLLGALIGGTGALTAARWMNRTSPQGKSMVQLGDEMLAALTADALLAYAGLTHVLPATARELATTLVASDPERYAPLWARARQGDGDDVAADLTDRLQADLAELKSRLEAASAPILYG
nr:DUF2868 domain-containing protein [Ramlibacter albus]